MIHHYRLVIAEVAERWPVHQAIADSVESLIRRWLLDACPAWRTRFGETGDRNIRSHLRQSRSSRIREIRRQRPHSKAARGFVINEISGRAVQRWNRTVEVG